MRLIGEQRFMVFPELSLIVRTERRFRRFGGVRVNVGERKLTVDQTNFIRVISLDELERWEQASAMRTFEVGELDDGDRRIGGPLRRKSCSGDVGSQRLHGRR